MNNFENKNVLGKRIKELRKQKGYTQKKLSELIGFSKDYVTKIELGLKIPPFTTYLKIANALEVDIYEISSADPVLVNLHETIDKVGIEKAIEILKKHI